MSLIIGFGHKRRRGKDLCKELMISTLQALGVEARGDSFAHSIKEGICKGVFGFNEEQIYGRGKFERDAFWGFTPRYAMQIAGTECMRRGFDNDIWVRTVEKRRREQPEVAVVLSDVRFYNEVEGIHRMGGVVVRVDRPIENVPATTTPGEDQHESETALDNFKGWDAYIMNDGSKAELFVKVVRLADAILSQTLQPGQAF